MTYQQKDTWERPFTTRRYLQPPFAEEIVTMWSQLALFIGEVYEKNQKDTPSACCQFLIGEDFHIPDFKTVRLLTSEDGAPVHGMVYDFGDYTLQAESVCDIKERPGVYTKFTLTNKTLWKVEDKFGFLLRTAPEMTLNGMYDLDGYCTHNPNIRAWGEAPRLWRKEKDDFLTDGTYNIYFKGTEDMHPEWIGERAGLYWFERGKHTFAFSLEPGEVKSFYMAFGKEVCRDFDYETEKAKAIAFWNKELERIKVYPQKENQLFTKMYRHLVSQLLQMFAHHVGKPDSLLIRQGSLQRRMWPAEAFEFLMALDRIGDFDDYTEKAYEMFFKKMQVTEGENIGQISTLDGSIPWASNTAAVVKGLAYKLFVKNDRKFYEKYRDNLYSAFCWLERTRLSTKDSHYEGKGIFPPMRSCDWEAVEQAWSMTDVLNLLTYKALLKTFVKYGDEAVSEIEEAIKDYTDCIRVCWENEIKDQPESDELLFYGSIGAKKYDPLLTQPNVGQIPRLITLGVFPIDSEYAKKYYSYYKNRNLIQNGLHDILTASSWYNMNWKGHAWYTSAGDYEWFKYYMATNQLDLAEETLKGQLKFSMTEEFYMLERYAANDKYYVPWSPNASANGRIIMMLCDFYKAD